ncbi:hypothetical protein OG439_27725 [Amycolatopsis sp. NBC_01307]|uniref:hypothetical protein n=1 Tax=Amycolatopsis sp. NBC_01307 TaxID=2903561 RepID=UPI002E0D8C3C|nr:hypothetical protein OG439_27725 [Amycolatopsis sp. NBC_01307]
MPLKHWATQNEAPELSVVRTVRDAVVQDWYLADDPALLRVVWPTGDILSSDAGAAARLDPPVPWVLQVGPGLGVFGPELGLYGPDGREIQGAGWRDYAEVMGGVADYWPGGLRDPEVMQAWEPGDPQPIVPPDPALDTAPLLRLAAMLDPETPATRTLLNLARNVQYKR